VLHEEYLRQVTRLGYQYQIAEAHKDLGRTALLGGDAHRTIEMHRLALPVYREIDDYLGASLCLLDMAGARTLQGAAHEHDAGRPGQASADLNTRYLLEAVRLFAAAAALRATNGIVLHPHRQPPHDRDLAILRERLGETAFTQAWADGRAMSLEQAAVYALAVTEPPAPVLSGTTGATDRPPLPGTAVEPNQPRVPATLTAAVERLSPRERDVAALVARGRTNRQIGAELVLSERTIDTHVRNILSKLGLTSRAQIAAWTVEQRLTPSPHP
jgi:non-specific serine/threonine protein kinase